MRLVKWGVASASAWLAGLVLATATLLINRPGLAWLTGLGALAAFGFAAWSSRQCMNRIDEAIGDLQQKQAEAKAAAKPAATPASAGTPQPKAAMVEAAT